MANRYECTGLRTDGDTGAVSPFCKVIRIVFRTIHDRTTVRLLMAKKLDATDDWGSYKVDSWRAVA